MRLIVCLMAVAGLLPAERFDVNTPGRITRPSDPQISPDGKLIAAIVARSNFEENRSDSELVLIDTVSGTERVLTRERRGLAQLRWSPDGTRLAFLAQVEGRLQILVLPMAGGEAAVVTRGAQGVQQYAWSPDGTRFAYVMTDEGAKTSGEERHNKSFKIGHNDFLVTAAPTLIPATTGDYRVPVTQSYRFYHALRDRGVATKFIGYPVAGHSPTDPVHQRDVYRRYVGWLKHYLD